MSLSRDLDRLDRSPLNHLRLAMLGVVLRVVELVGDDRAPIGQHPFIADYLGDLEGLCGRSVPSAQSWRSALAEWSKGHRDLPLERLKAAGIDDLGIEILLTLGFTEEDGRLVGLFGDGGRLTLGALAALCRAGEDDCDGRTIVSEALRLCDFGMIATHDEGRPRHAWEYAVVPGVWDALSGTPRLPAGFHLTPADALPDADSFVPPRETFTDVASIAAVVRTHAPILCVRGPTHNGRHLLTGCIVKELARPLLELNPAIIENPASWALAGTLACVTGAGLVIELATGLGESRVLPPFPFGDPLLVVVSGVAGGIQSADRRAIVTIEVPAPDRAARAAMWRHVASAPEPLAEELAHRFRLTSGNLVRAAESASIRAGLSNAHSLQADEVRIAVRGLHDSRLDAVARRVEPIAAGDFISLDEAAIDELDALAARCRHRETLNRDGPMAGLGSSGVRALFAGPSGTGKTLSARWLAQRLGKDMFRLDLAASVSKYIGETEKVLDRAFAAAEDLDCILLIDEGDALMTRRTDVGSANDRYANLETNFLLQRIEAFDGILVVTTNAAERIDKAFGRRMDVVVQFRPPDEVRRYAILDSHLGDHAASDRLLQEIACRCTLTGGQLRNVAQHARLLALDGHARLGDEQLRAALVREYRKVDAHCPLKPHLAAAG